MEQDKEFFGVQRYTEGINELLNALREGDAVIMPKERSKPEQPKHKLIQHKRGLPYSGENNRTQYYDLKGNLIPSPKKEKKKSTWNFREDFRIEP